MSSPTSAGSAQPRRPEATGPPPDSPTAAAPTVPVPRRWLILFGVLVVALIGSAIVLVLVVSPPSYEPVPIPSVSRT